MRSLLTMLAVGSLVMLSVACGAKAPANPLGGAINTGGKPDVDKSKGTISTGGTPNAGGKPDLGKTKGTIGPGGKPNAGGAPDLEKSVPSSK